MIFFLKRLSTKKLGLRKYLEDQTSMEGRKCLFLDTTKLWFEKKKKIKVSDHSVDSTTKQNHQAIKKEML